MIIGQFACVSCRRRAAEVRHTAIPSPTRVVRAGAIRGPAGRPFGWPSGHGHVRTAWVWVTCETGRPCESTRSVWITSRVRPRCSGRAVAVTRSSRTARNRWVVDWSWRCWPRLAGRGTRRRRRCCRSAPSGAAVQRSSGRAALRRPWQVADGLLCAGGFELNAERDRVGHQRQQVGASGRGLRFGR